jgi:hypothetical protein
MPKALETMTFRLQIIPGIFSASLAVLLDVLINAVDDVWGACHVQAFPAACDVIGCADFPVDFSIIDQFCHLYSFSFYNMLEIENDDEV